LAKAENAARNAIDRITDKTSKDYADLQILLGDLAKAKGDKDAATSFYDEAIAVAGTDDAERSEISARAHFQKGVLARLSAELDKAAQIWADLDEDHNSDEARWQSLKLSNRIPPGAEAILAVESSSVRLEVLRLHEARLETLGRKFRGRRSEPDKNYLQELVREAKKNVAVRHREW
jgi:tetratricopeptide (TPR) repeat protein